MFARDERLIELAPVRPGDVVASGLDSLTGRMAASLGDRLHLSTSAVAVEQADHRVGVDYSGPSGAGRVSAEYVVSAIPATVLRRMSIEPPLDPPQRAAIDGLRYCDVMKVHLQFRRRFWLEGGPTLGMMSDLPIQSAWDSTHAQPGVRGILSIYAADAAARSLAALPALERFAFCLDQLERVYPGCGALYET